MQVRSLSKQKFLCMAHMEKITGLQQQQQQQQLNPSNGSSTNTHMTTTTMMCPPKGATTAGGGAAVAATCSSASSASSAPLVGGVPRALPPASPITATTGGLQPPHNQHSQHSAHAGLPVPKYPTRAELDR